MNVSDTRDCAFEAFITNLGKYNEGYLVGEWVKFPVTNEEMQAVFRRIGISHTYEEWFITDYDCPDEAIGKVLGEYESLSELNYLAGQIMELRESDEFWQAVLDLGENTGSVQELINLTENLDCFAYLSGVRNDYDLGYYWIEESGCYDTASSAHWQTISTMRASAGMFGLKKAACLAITAMCAQTAVALWTSTTATLRTSPKNIGSVLPPSPSAPQPQGRLNSPNDKICTFDIVLPFGYSIIKKIRK